MTAVVMTDDQEVHVDEEITTMFEITPVSKTSVRLFDRDEIIMKAILHYSSLYLPPIIIGLGLLGNTLAYVVLCHPRYKQSSNCCYMRALAVFDNITLLGRYAQRYVYVSWPHVFLADKVVADIFCREYLFISTACMSTAHWILSLMTLDRFIAVSIPLKAKIFCSVKRAKICISISVIAFSCIFMPNLLRTYNPDGLTLISQCPLRGHFKWYEHNIWTFYSTGCLAVPVLVVFICNMGIVVVLKMNKKQRDATCTINKGGNKTESNTERNITLMLLLVSWSSFIIMLPVLVDYFFWDVIKPIPVRGKTVSVRKFMYDFIMIPRMLNSAVNFVFYFLGCSKFRKDLVSITMNRKKDLI
jgi:hypothetical protein